MKVFISSVIGGFEEFRAAAASGATSLGHELVRAEDFGASATSPQRTCLAGVRAADVMVLVMGRRYGEVQGSGLSATHEEYREAREADKVLAFVQRGITPEPRQQAFIEEVQQWEGGHYTADFQTPEDLRGAVTRDLHRFELARAAGATDDQEVLKRALECLSGSAGTGEALDTCVACGPRASIIRPSEISGTALGELLSELSVVGAARMFPIEGSGRASVADGRLTFSHRQGAVSIDELGTVLIRQSPKAERVASMRGFGPLIEEDVEARIVKAVRFAGVLLDQVDPTARLTTVVPVVRLAGGTTAWMSRVEADAMKGAMTLNTRADAPPAHLSPPSRRRAMLTSDAPGLARDLTAMLRRAVVTGRGPL